jgi:hypothetical protein
MHTKPLRTSPLPKPFHLPAPSLECAKALLRAGADPNYMNGASDLTLFWAIDGGPAMIQLLVRFGADLDHVTPKVGDPVQLKH